MHVWLQHVNTRPKGSFLSLLALFHLLPIPDQAIKGVPAVFSKPEYASIAADVRLACTTPFRLLYHSLTSKPDRQPHTHMTIRYTPYECVYPGLALSSRDADLFFRGLRYPYSGKISLTVDLAVDIGRPNYHHCLL
jgi:hypothetical protein